MPSTTLSVRVDSELKHQAEMTYGALGQTLSSAITTFLTKSVMEGGFPFDMKLTEKQKIMLAAKQEADDMLSSPEEFEFMDVEDFLEELKR